MERYILDNVDNRVYELVTKKSRFIAKAYYVQSVQDVEKILERVKKEYRDAKHIVYAYRLENTGKFTDDKEPQGTAGKPIYSLLEKENLINTLIIVIRYFGGILLGSGPLTRAYASSAKEALNMCNKKEYVEYIEKSIKCEYGEEENTKRAISLNKGIIQEIQRTDKIEIKYLEPKEL